MNSKCVLVVEDEFLVALDMEIVLGEAGFEVLGPAGSVAEALRLIAGHRLDAALLDNNLNGESVGPVATALSERHVPFAFVSGNDRASLPAAFDHVVLVGKPFSPAHLVEIAISLTA
jgi:CheY-like chemotaxis protein